MAQGPLLSAIWTRKSSGQNLRSLWNSVSMAITGSSARPLQKSTNVSRSDMSLSMGFMLSLPSGILPLQSLCHCGPTGVSMPWKGHHTPESTSV